VSLFLNFIGFLSDGTDRKAAMKKAIFRPVSLNSILGPHSASDLVMEARSAREESAQTVLEEILSHRLCDFSVHITRAEVGETTYRNVAETATESSLETHLDGD